MSHFNVISNQIVVIQAIIVRFIVVQNIGRLFYQCNCWKKSCLLLIQVTCYKATKGKYYEGRKLSIKLQLYIYYLRVYISLGFTKTKVCNYNEYFDFVQYYFYAIWMLEMGLYFHINNIYRKMSTLYGFF